MFRTSRQDPFIPFVTERTCLSFSDKSVVVVVGWLRPVGGVRLEQTFLGSLPMKEGKRRETLEITKKEQLWSLHLCLLSLSLFREFLLRREFCRLESVGQPLRLTVRWPTLHLVMSGYHTTSQWDVSRVNRFRKEVHTGSEVLPPLVGPGEGPIVLRGSKLFVVVSACQVPTGPDLGVITETSWCPFGNMCLNKPIPLVSKG